MCNETFSLGGKRSAPTPSGWAQLGEAIMQFAEQRVLLLVDAPEGPAEDGDEAIGTGGL